MDRYCSSMVHLLRGRELGFRNALTGNVKTRCTKHKILQMCGDMYDCDGSFDDRVYSYLVICDCMIRGFHYDEGNYYEDDGNYYEDEDEEGEERIHVCLNNYTEDEKEIKRIARRIRDEVFIAHDEDMMMKLVCHPYKFKVVKEYDDIYIEIRSCLDGEVYMTIDAKKIIPILSVPLEEWEKFKKEKKLGPLITQAYACIIDSVGELTDSATCELKSKTSEDMWEGCRLKRGVWNHYYVSYSEKFEPILLPRAAFKDEQ